MAAWAIDTFQVKPSGLLANWRAVRIYVDENGVISRKNVPGFESVNNNCISDYKKSDRRYSQGQDITNFCNLTTHTFYKVFAQNCSPFAYVQAFTNSAGCGYEAPQPPKQPITNPWVDPVTPPTQGTDFPAVPPNIFGERLSYSLYKYLDFCDIDGNAVLVNIYRKSFTGTAIEIVAGGKSPVVLSYKRENKFTPVCVPECKLSFICDANFDLSELYTNDQREFGIEVIKNDQSVFVGYILPDSCNEPFKAPPYPVSIRASSGLSELKKITYPLPSGSKVNLRQTLISILSYCFAKTDLGIGINTICNLYDVKMDTGLNDDPLAQASVNPLRFTHDNGQIYNIYEVLEALCKQFGAYITQINSVWHFVRVDEMSQFTIRKRVYNSFAFFIRGENLTPLRNAGLSEDVTVLEGGEISIGNAYKRVEVMLKYGNSPSIIFNGDFELWDGDNFTYWTRFGGIDISRVQNTVKGVGGALIPIPNYSLQFNKKYDIAKYLQSDAIDVLKGDQIAFSLNIGNTVSTVARFKMGVKIGSWSLYNEPGTTVFSWVNSLANITLDINNQGGSVNNFITSIKAPNAPISGQMTIQLYGFSQLIEQSSGSGRPSRSGGNLVESSTYTPVLIDNFSLKKTTEDDKSIPDSQFNVSSQLGFYTETPDLTETIFGDFQQVTALRPSRSTETQSVVSDLYAIYTKDKSYSTGWINYGQTSKPLPINLALSNSILKAHQRPFRFYSGKLLGENLSYIDTFNLITPGQTEFSAKIFSWLNVDFDLFYNTADGVLAEIFTKNIDVTNIVVPINPGQEPPKISGIKNQMQMSLGTPPYVQNPNNISLTLTEGGIFTDEFTQEFS